MGMALKEKDLLPTEEVLISKFANLRVKPSQHGLSEFAFNDYLGDNEALGGRAYLTNYRILFKSHSINRLVGMHSLFLPNIVEIRKGIFGIKVESRAQTFSFVMWFNGRFVRTARECKDEMGTDEVKRLRKLIKANPERIGALQKHATLEVVNKVLKGVVAVADVIEKMSSPDRSMLAELVELFGQG